ncbi:hypothetical protein DVDV_2022 [Desulfovibrio sp. DV]|nr:hypothetical protein DVDV_2022 [Desulfovibrio sp. DV]
MVAAIPAAAGLIPATAGCRVCFGQAGGRLCLPEAQAEAVLLDILARAGEVHDELFNEAGVAELTGRWPWAELTLPQPRNIPREDGRGLMTVSRLLVVFRNDLPSYVFWGDPDYRLDAVLGAPQLGRAPLAALRALPGGSQPLSDKAAERKRSP